MTRRTRTSSPSLKQFTALFGLAMSLFYGVLGCLLLFRLQVFPNDIWWNKALGGCFILYAIFRGYRVYVKFKTINDQDDDE